MKHILLVEDDPEISQLLQLHYNEPNYQLTATASGSDGLAKALAGNFDLVILDLTLPDLDGMEICRSIREHKISCAIMMLTSKSEEIDKVLALELGADDYVTKPFGIRELMARTKALIRHSEQAPHHTPEQQKEITVKDLAIDMNLRKATLKGERLELTPKEFDLLVLCASGMKNTRAIWYRKHSLPLWSG
jgi:two-component system alkaline phosphatase synthesis response regulator PhoP